MDKKIVSITVASAFSAKHWHDKTLNEAVHTHNFKYEVSLKGPLNEEGYLVDFRSLENFLNTLNAKLENRTLNDLMPAPTTENLAIYIFEETAKVCPMVYQVKVQEKENYYAAYAR
ncbi:MAG: 6-carboxytetrahydropterin synthase [Elusimicrobiota bacterium]|jgi:6-pyruvoyltetrahydropterin/6-carboxytetrahydropterin synthase|nr:6-carboxytetrahydropterin synthase [Elusimicrobiota bacterium]